jgi:aspartyl protease family protein
MEQNHPPQDSSVKWGKGMLTVFWLLCFGLLTLYFSDMLDEQYNPNQRPVSYASQSGVEVTLQRNKMGHYVASGYINGRPVIFMLDTGATNVSVPAHLARRLDLQAGRTFTAQTANGSVRVSATRINELKLGDITLFDVDASLNPGMQDNEILLGMSALKQLEFTQSGDQLTLRQK